MLLSAVRSTCAWLRHRYYMYELHTSVAMLEPREKIAINSFFVLLLSMVFYSSYVFLPHYTVALLSRIGVTSQ